MLSSSDAQLVARESALPGLSFLLNDEAFAAVLATHLPDVEVCSARATYVRYKLHTSCLVAFAVETYGGGALAEQGGSMLYAVAHRPDNRPKWTKQGKGHLELNELATVVYRFPNDRRLRSLAQLMHEEKRRTLLQRALPAHPELWGASVSPLRYKPERRYVARLDAEYSDESNAGGRQALLKLYTPDDFEVVSRNSKVLQSRTAVSIPSLLGRSRRYGLQVLEWCEGQSLEARLGDMEMSAAIGGRVGAALAALHSQRPRNVRRYDLDDDRRALRAAQQSIHVLLPHLSDRVERLCRLLCENLADRRPKARIIHGDFSSDQVLLNGQERVVILDLDRAGYGDAAADFGSFAAHLQQNAVAGRIAPQQADGWLDALLSGYDRVTRQKVRTERVQSQRSMHLLRRMVEPFRYRLDDWTTVSEQLLVQAERR